MSTIENTLDLEQQIASGMALEDARFHFSQILDHPQLDNETFEVTVVNYLNALQNRWFEQNQDERYHVINNLARYIKNEFALIMPNISTEPIEDINPRISTYLEDQTAQSLIAHGTSAYPRAASMVMLDMIDAYRTV